MRRTFFILTLAFLSIFASSAQDRIHFLDSRVVEAVVDEVGNELIYYRSYHNQNGPLYSVPVSHVEKIVYHNGYEQVVRGGMLFNDDLLTAVGGVGGKMRFANGKLYLGSHSYYGQMQADYIAFNLYGDDYYKARRRRTTGHTLTWVGASVFTFGFLLLAGSDIPEGGAVIMGIGAAGMGAGIPLICNGNKILKGIASDYNSRLSPDYKPNLTFGPCRSGVGFAMNF